ncbi:MAG: hypothetical protein ACMXX9_03265 [Candidatus Woesearchaeota archaeon]
MEKTTIQIKKSTLNRLKNLKNYERESYDEILNKVMDNVDEEILTDEEIKDIKISLDNVKKGKTKSIEQVAKDMGISLN